jgi:mannose-6-phosphate isomerase-like protein (cupin superfamily)
VNGARVISPDEVEPVELPQGSWSRVLVSEHTVSANRTALGYSVFTPGLITSDMSHEAEELAFVVSGSGLIRLEDGELKVAAGQALYIPAGLWHTVVNDSAEDLTMVFAFASPDYPATERREPRR